jgi:hypothetical protein
MSDEADDPTGGASPPGAALTPAALTPAARRALAEAAARRKAEAAKAPTGETGGPAGPEPTRYGDWERKGRAVDF